MSAPIPPRPRSVALFPHRFISTGAAKTIRKASDYCRGCIQRAVPEEVSPGGIGFRMGGSARHGTRHELVDYHSTLCLKQQAEDHHRKENFIIKK
jgi:hypothetical protein